jgi:thiol:disulfide interchange protein DsbD
MMMLTRTSLALVMLWVASLVHAAPGDDDPFADANKAGKAPPTKGAAETARPRKADPTDPLIQFRMSVQPAEAKPGQTVHVTIDGKILKPGYHTYPLTKRTKAQEVAQLTQLEFEPNPHLQFLWPVTETKPDVADEGPAVGTLLEHKKPFQWAQDVLILPNAPPGKIDLHGKIVLQVCDERGCIRGVQTVEQSLQVLPGSVPLTPELEKRRTEKPPEPEVVATPGAFGDVATERQAKQDQPEEPTGPRKSIPGVFTISSQTTLQGVLAFMGQGLFWGFLSLLTPCVFPMIPITVSVFLKQSEKQHYRPLLMAFVYSATIVVVLTAGGLLLMRWLRPISQHYATNFFLGSLFVFFALSLFGMYEIVLPGWLANFTSARQGQEGLLGIVFMALTFTIISFTCVAPFYGGFIGLAATAQSAADWLTLVLGALSFSVAFASPFFFLALFPSLLRSMPKSGSWMNTVKVVMGFLELAAAFKFLRAAELFFLQTGRAQFLTYDLVLGTYVAIALLAGLYLLGFYRLPHDYEAPEQIGVPRFLMAAVFLTLGFYLMPALFKQPDGEQQRPSGTVFAWLDSFLLSDEPDQSPTPGPAATSQSRGASSHQLAWIGNLEKGLRQAQDQKKLVFVDFTGKT